MYISPTQLQILLSMIFFLGMPHILLKCTIKYLHHMFFYVAELALTLRESDIVEFACTLCSRHPRLFNTAHAHTLELITDLFRIIQPGVVGRRSERFLRDSFSSRIFALTFLRLLQLFYFPFRILSFLSCIAFRIRSVRGVAAKFDSNRARVRGLANWWRCLRM